MLPFTSTLRMAQGRQNRRDRKHPGKHIRHGYPDLMWRTIGWPGDRHQPAHRLDHIIVAGTLMIRASLTKSGDTAINQGWIDTVQIVVTQAELCHLPDFEILDDDMAFSSELTGKFTS